MALYKIEPSAALMAVAEKAGIPVQDTGLGYPCVPFKHRFSGTHSRTGQPMHVDLPALVIFDLDDKLQSKWRKQFNNLAVDPVSELEPVGVLFFDFEVVSLSPLVIERSTHAPFFTAATRAGDGAALSLIIKAGKFYSENPTPDARDVIIESLTQNPDSDA
jgi:hypothetical protein